MKIQLLIRSLCYVGSAAALLLGAVPLHAAETIGNAVGITPAAVGTVSGELDLNLPVYRDETVTTGPTGVLELKFLDQTRLAVQSSSSVTLDRFVYAGAGRVDDLVLSLSKGVFRFATGVSSKKAYWIQTPLAGIGVRGTDFTAEITPSYERFTIWEGAIKICPRIAGLSVDQERRRVCPLLKNPGSTVTLYNNGTKKLGGTPVTFTGHCAQASGSALCGLYGGDSLPNSQGHTFDQQSPPSPTPPTRPTRGRTGANG